MEIVYHLVVVLHLLGMAALVGGFLTLLVARAGGAVEVMVWGARAQLLTGLVLVGLGSAIDSLDESPNNTKVAVKLLVALAVVACLEIARARGKRTPGTSGAGTGTGTGMVVPPLVSAGGYLGLLNVLVAVLWT